MTDNCVYISLETLKKFFKDVFVKTGASEEDAEVCADVLMTADKWGVESHGVGRLRYYHHRIKTGQHQMAADFEVVRESPTTAVVDGHHAMGMVTAKRAMQMAIDKARVYGMGSVAVRNSTHYGVAGYYPMMAVQQGMIGYTVTNARPSVAPTFGVQPMLGTNPIAFGAPTDEEFPFIYDAATPITQRGKIEVLAREEKPIPPGWVINFDNQPMTDSATTLAALGNRTASFVPLGGVSETYGGHKGYGLGTMVEILSSALQTGTFMLDLTGIGPDGKPQPFRIGHFFMAINIEHFVELEVFKATTGKIVRTLRSAQKAPGCERIYTAFEKEYETSKITQVQGVKLIPKVQNDLKILQQELNINGYDFPF